MALIQIKEIKMPEKIKFGGWPNCIRLNNGESELVITTDIGPRIVRFGFINGRNLFHLIPGESGKTGGNQWRLYGGHRLWIAPEEIPKSFHPDNDPVKYSYSDHSIKLTAEKESTTGVMKELDITLAPDKNEVTVVHRLINLNNEPTQLCPWALSMMSQGGRAIIPQEPYGEGDDYLLPARTIALWQYTKMNDPRWIWGEGYIQAKQDPALASEQKIGIMNKQGWTAYYLNEEILIKKFLFDPQATYTDNGSNNETYINGQFLEIETLGSLVVAPPGGIVEHTEHWLLERVKTDESEYSIDTQVLPIVKAFRATI